MTEVRSLENIEFKVQSRRKQGLFYAKPVHSFDTENKPAEAALILSSDVRPFTVQSLDDCLRVMTANKYRSSLNTFWNIDYDIASIFKHEPEVMEDLYTTGRAEYKKHDFSYIENRVFTIRKSKKKFSFYDVQQYFKDSTPSLADASKKYLGKEPNELKSERGDMFDRYDMRTISLYCQSDCILTKELTEYLCQGLDRIGFIPPDLTSVGSVSRKFCIQHSNIPMVNYMPSLELIDAYYQAYKGGWFEICKRGLFKTYGYDIVSAYPTITRELPDIRQGDFIKITEPEEIDFNDEYGCVLVWVKNKKDSRINPLSVKISSGLFYPVLDKPVLMYITLREYRAFTDVYNFTFVEGWIFRPFVKHVFKPFAKVIDKLYAIKEAEKEAGRKGSADYMTSKLVMNSIYGNTIQTTDNGEEVITGNLFNPFYAAEITAYCRVRMWEAIRRNVKDIIMIATDGVYSRKPLPVKIDSALGGWEREHDGDNAVFIASGIYQFEGEESKGRGVGRQDFFDLLSIKNPFDLLEPEPDILKINLKSKRVKVKEAIAQHRIQDVNKFEPRIKTMKLNGEISNRRDWLTEPERFGDLLNGQYESTAHFLSFLEDSYAHKLQAGKVAFNAGSWENKFKFLEVSD